MNIKCLYDHLVNIDELKAKKHPKNPNKHPEDQIIRLAKIMKVNGVRSPIVVSKRSGFITKGHGRLEAAIFNEWKEYPVNYQDYEDEAQEYSDMTADNAISSWSVLDLSQINQDFLEFGPDFDVDLLGIKDFEVEPIDKLEPVGDEEHIPETKPDPETVEGDIWKLGRHRLMCGDSTNVNDVDSLMCGKEASMVFTSPPYNIGKNGFEEKGKYENDTDSKEHFDEFLSEFMDTWILFSKYQFINMQFLSKNKVALIDWLHKYKNSFVDIVSCSKDTTLPAMEKNVLNSDFELVFIFGEDGSKRHIKMGKEFRGSVSNLVEMKRNRSKVSKDHRAGFDISFPLNFLEPMTGNDSIIADPFGGTGTTLIACEKTGRTCYMMELDPQYVRVIIDRWEKYTGQKAELIS